MPRLIVSNVEAHSIPSCKLPVRLKLALAPCADLDSIQQQAICKFASLQELKAIAWWRVGLGKTRLALGLFALRAQHEGTLPIVSLFVARPAFEYDLRAELRNIGFDCHIAIAGNAWRLSMRKPTIFFTSFASLQKVLRPISEVRRRLNLVIVDELYLYSNPKSQRSQLLRQLTDDTPAIGLAGTILPAGDNFAVWGQCCALGMERMLARGTTRFRSEFQTSISVDFKNGHAPAMLFRNKPDWKERALGRIAKNIDVQFPAKLNRTIDKITKVPLTDEQKTLIKNLVDNFYLEIQGHEFDFSYIFQTTVRIRGILNGWVALEPGRLHYVESKKVTTLVDELSELVECREQCIVWCAFRNDVSYLASKVPFASLQLVGGRPFDVARWKRKDVFVTLATLGSGSSINHFEQTAYSKFFSLTHRSLDLQQAKGRTDRRSTVSENVFYEFLQCETSLDGEIYRHCQQVKSTEEDFIRSAKLWLKTLHSHSDHRTKS